jgi:hypothetical protein
MSIALLFLYSMAILRLPQGGMSRRFSKKFFKGGGFPVLGNHIRVIPGFAVAT